MTGKAMSVAATPSRLAKRVKYFLSRERKRDDRLSRLLDNLPPVVPAYLFGGIIRDIALFGNRELFRSDIDIVCVGPEKRLRKLLQEFLTKNNLQRNKFGGFRISTDLWLVDIWSAETTWAFKQGLRPYEGIQSLLDTTITNWEGILFSLHEKNLLYRDNYFRDIQRGYLDVVLVENPNPLGMYVKVMRSYIDKGASVFSGQAVQVLRKAVSDYSFEDLSAYAKSRYKTCYINENTFNKITLELKHRDCVGPIQLDKSNETLTLF